MQKSQALDDIVRARIIRWRHAAGLTQAALGKAVGRSAVWVSRYERAHYGTDLDTVSRMAVALGHNLLAALDLRDHVNVREREIVEVYRAIRKHQRPFALDVFRALARGLKPRD